MLLIRCPNCEMDRPEIEFRYAGEAGLRRPDPLSATDAKWTAYLFLRRNPKGDHAERWRHLHGCGRFFNAMRDTVSDRLLATWRVGEPPPAEFVEGGDA